MAGSLVSGVNFDKNYTRCGQRKNTVEYEVVVDNFNLKFAVHDSCIHLSCEHTALCSCRMRPTQHLSSLDTNVPVCQLPDLHKR